jgi:hypothetical protein
MKTHFIRPPMDYPICGRKNGSELSGDLSDITCQDCIDGLDRIIDERIEGGSSDPSHSSEKTPPKDSGKEGD